MQANKTLLLLLLTGVLIPFFDIQPSSVKSSIFQIAGVVINEFKAYQPPVESNDYLPQIVEEYVLETKLPPKDKNKQRVYHIKLSILQRPSNSEYLGELYLDRDHKENERNGVACRFTLGTRMHVNKYLQQFSETFTKSGRQSVVMRRGGRNTNFKISLGQLQVNNMSVCI